MRIPLNEKDPDYVTLLSPELLQADVPSLPRQRAGLDRMSNPTCSKVHGWPLKGFWGLGFRVKVLGFRV